MNTESVSKRDLEDLRFQLNFQAQNYERQLSDLRANLEKTVKQHAAEPFSLIRDAGRSSTPMQGSSIRLAFAEHRQRVGAYFPRARTQRLR